jgi:hypothetical protein
MQVKEIENWNKLNAKKVTMIGCDFYFTEAKTNDNNLYTVNIIEQVSKEVYFRVDLWLADMHMQVKVFFPSPMTSPPKTLETKIRRENLSNPAQFASIITETCIKDSVTFSLLELLSEIQSTAKHSKSNSGSVLGANLTSQGIISSSVMW